MFMFMFMFMLCSCSCYVPVHVMFLFMLCSCSCYVPVHFHVMFIGCIITCSSLVNSKHDLTVILLLMRMIQSDKGEIHVHIINSIVRSFPVYISTSM
jgi:hypothetical protein